MSWMNRLAALFRARKLNAELEEELRYHLESRERQYVAEGMTPEEAKRQARRAFGGRDRAIEACRDADRIAWLESAWRDLCYAVRTLRASPLFTLTAVASLALGIGANTAVFTLLHATLWKPLPVRQPEQLVHLLRADPTNSSDMGGAYSHVLFRQIAEAARPFGEVAAKAGFGQRKFGLDISCPERVAGEAVSANFFSVLGVSPALGRTFAPDDGRVAILSHAFWTRRFQSDPAVLGRVVFYKETPYTVIGVAQRGFTGVEAETSIDVWVPIASDVPAAWLTSVDHHWMRLVARLRPGTKPVEAQSALDAFFRATIQRELLPRVGEHFKPMVAAQHLIVKPAAAGLASTGRRYAKPLLLLLGVVSLVLLISCANVANLVLARNAGRAREIAMRLALGAGRGRIISQLLTESLVLALVGAMIGITIASPACRILLNLLPQPALPWAFDFRPDSTVLAFTAAVAAATAILFGLAPALRAARVQPGSTRTTARTLTGRILVSGQLALSLVLLIGAGLFLGTVRNLRTIDLGFRPDHVVTFGLSFPRGTPAERIRQTYAEVRSGLANSPDVISASFDTGGGWSLSAEVEGRPAAPGEDNEVGVIAAGPDWFETIGLPLLQGRYLTERDIRDSPAVAVINARLARKYFGTASAIGRRMRFGIERYAALREIVGVVRDAKHYGVKEKEWPMVFLPADREGSFVVRTRDDHSTIAATIRAVVARSGVIAQVERIRHLQDAIDEGLGQERLLAALSTVFGALATLLAALGLYGVLSYNVSRRTAELGIRMALGAQRRDVESLVLRETVRMILAGTAAGLAGAFVLTRSVTTMLYGIRPADATVYAGAAFALALVAVIAGWIPSRRASRVDPMVALRYE